MSSERVESRKRRSGTYRNFVYSNLRVVLLGLELELDVETQHLRVDKALGLLLESGVRERLLESDSSNQERVL
jgi:hypothetical protein